MVAYNIDLARKARTRSS